MLHGHTPYIVEFNGVEIEEKWTPSSTFTWRIQARCYHFTTPQIQCTLELYRLATYFDQQKLLWSCGIPDGSQLTLEWVRQQGKKMSGLPDPQQHA